MVSTKRPASVSAAAPAAKRLTSSSQAEASGTVELSVGEVRYPCLCTRDPKVADDWAAQVLKSAATSESASVPVAVVSLDCEWAAPWYRGPGVPDRLATLQLAHHGSEGTRVLVFAVVGLNGKLPPALTSLLGDARVVKVGANLAGDATRVVRDFGCPVRGVFDLRRLNMKPGAKHAKSMSLEAVIKANCPREMHLSKAGADVRTSNWEDWPLSEEQVLYASRDAALGLMAFMFKFDMSLTGSADLSKAAIDALVDLVSIDAKAVSDTSAGEAESNHASFFQHMRNKNVKPPNLGKKTHPKGAKDALANVCIVVSGTLDSFERPDMEKYVQEHGGKVSKSVTAKVTHLVSDHGEAGPSKLAKCKELGIPVVSEDIILQMVTKTSDSMPVEASSSVSAKDSTKQQGRQGKRVADADGSPIATQGKQAKATDATKATADAAEPVAKKPRTTKRALAKEAVADAEPVLDTAPAAKAVPVAKVARAAKAIAKKVRATRGSKRTLSAKPAHIAAESSAKLCSPSDSKKSTGGAAADISTIVRKRMCSKSAEGSGKVKSKDVAESATKKPQAPSGLKKRKAKEMVQPAKAVAPKDGIDEASVDVLSLGAKKGKQNSKADVGLGETPQKRAPKEVQTPPEKAPKKAPKKVPASQAGAVELDGATLSKAEALSMRSELTNLAGRPELQGKGLSAASLLAALEKTNGLVNSAKRLLLGI